MNHVRCNFCDQDDTELVNEGPDLLLNRGGCYRLVRCRSCGLIYQNPQLSRAELAAHYPDDYLLYKTEDDKVASRLDQLSETHGQGRRRDRVLRHRSEPGVILDIGCASGQFLGVMRAAGWEAVGVELSSYAAELARQTYGIEVHIGTLEEARLPSAHFDVVTMWDVFEHVLDPKATLVEIGRLLKPGGLLVLHLPNPTSIEAALFGSNWVGWERPRHLHLFTPEVLQNYLRATGFDRVSLESFSGRLSVTLLSLEFALKRRGVTEACFRPWLRRAYNWPLRLATWPLYKLGERFNKTTGMTAFARKLPDT